MTNPRADLELKRKVFHAGSGVAAIAAVFIFGPVATAWGLLFLLITGIALLKLMRKRGLAALEWCCRHLERPENMEKAPGKSALLYALGCLLTIVLFRDINVIAGSIAILAFGDPAAYAACNFCDLKKFSGARSYGAFAAGTLVGFAAASFFVRPAAAFAASFAAMGADALFSKRTGWLDDNLVIPVAAGTMLYFIKVFGF